jgi:salicylate hydroxylase
MISHFKGWGKDMISILECIEKPSKWALHQLIPTLDSYVKGNIAVTGDAAHGGTPHQGAMAGQAIEDALFLSRLLSHPSVNASNVDQALQVYNQIRLPRANRVLQSSLEAGDVYELAGEAGFDQQVEARLKENLDSRFSWIWEVSRLPCLARMAA